MSENPITIEPSGRNEITFAGNLESLIRNNETFKDVFIKGLNQHLRKLQLSAQTNDEEQPDITSAYKNFTELKQVISSGFEGYEFRAYSGSPKSSSVAVNFAKAEDLDPENLSRLDLSNGKRKEEYEVVISRLIDTSSYSNDPAMVVGRKGIHLEISKKSLIFNDRIGEIRMKKHDGFSINITVDGDCTGKATKHDGVIPYDSRGTYKIPSNGLSTLLKQATLVGL